MSKALNFPEKKNAELSLSESHVFSGLRFSLLNRGQQVRPWALKLWGVKGGSRTEETEAGSHSGTNCCQHRSQRTTERGERKRENERRRAAFPPHWSSFISPGRGKKCQLRCWEFISPATCTVIVLYSESLGLHQAWACKWGVENWLPKSQEQETSKFAKVCGTIWMVKSTSGTKMRRGCFKM